MNVRKYVLCLTAMLVIVAYACVAAAFTKDFFIWDRDAAGNAAGPIFSALSGAGYFGDQNTTLPGLAQLVNYRTVWICLGTFPNADPLIAHPTEITNLSNYLANYDSTCVYMEGGDCWYLDPWTSFHNYFHIRNWGKNGYPWMLLGTLYSQTGTFADGMTFDYGGDNAFPDQLVEDSTSVPDVFYLFKNNDPDTGYGVMVAYDNGSCTYKTIASSCEFAGLTDASPPSTKITLADSIMSFFCVPKIAYAYDVATIGISIPEVLTPPNEGVYPASQVKNAGTNAAAGFWAYMKIGTYKDSVQVASLAPDSIMTVSFKQWTAGAVGQQYQACSWVRLSSDLQHGNDSLCKDITAWDDRWYIKSPWTSNGANVVLRDGISPGEWDDAVHRDVSDFLGKVKQHAPGSAILYVMNDSFNLYIALDAVCDGSSSDNDVWNMLFDDNGDEAWPSSPDSSEGFTKIINHPAPAGPWFSYQPYFNDASAVSYYVTINAWSDNTLGNMQYEYIIRFGRDAAVGDSVHPHLWAGLCDTVRFSMTAADDGTKQAYSWWPTSMGLFPDVLTMGQIILNCGLDRYTEIEVASIVNPPADVYVGQQYPIGIQVKNNGNYNESFDLYYAIGDTLSPVRYDTISVIDLYPDSTKIIAGALWTVPAPANTTYAMCAWITVADSNVANNSTCKDITTHIVGAEELSMLNSPRVFSLGQASPNPFSERTTSTYAVPKDTRVTVEVLDIAGRVVRVLATDQFKPGFYTVSWNGRTDAGDRVPNGVYFLSMQTPEFTSVKKMVLLK